MNKNSSGTTPLRILCLLAGLAAACAAPSRDGETPDDGVGEAHFDLTTAPTGALCVRVVATPATGTAVTKTFAVAAGQSTVGLSLGPLAAGATQFTGDAFTVACASIATAAPGWTADPVTVAIRAGTITNVPLTFRPDNPVTSSVNFVRNVLGLAAGGYSTVALTDAAPVEWGYVGTPSPTPLASLPDAIAVAMGSFHVCFIRKDGTVWCQGLNTYGQLGPNATGTSSTTPVQVPLAGPFTLITAGHLHTCAYRPSPAGIFCWGYNGDGELGNGTTGGSSATPVAVTGAVGQPIRALASGYYHNLAATGDGHFLAWGYNQLGQLGDGTTTGRSTAGLTSAAEAFVVGVAAGGYHSCTVHADGSFSCWGSNGNGESGDPTLASHLTPFRVTFLPAGVTQLALGVFHTCARLVDGRVACWGYNYHGEIASGTASSSATPVFVDLGGDTAQSLSAGLFHACALTPTFGVTCWGQNDNGQIGDGTMNNAFLPVKVTLQ